MRLGEEHTAINEIVSGRGALRRPESSGAHRLSAPVKGHVFREMEMRILYLLVLVFVLSPSGKLQAQALSGNSTNPNVPGVAGDNPNGIGTRGTSKAGTGIIGTSEQGVGIWGHSNTSSGAGGVSESGIGVHGVSAQVGPGVRGDSEKGVGVFGGSKQSTAVGGISESGRGVHGISTSGTGVEGNSTNGPGIWGATKSNAAAGGEFHNNGGGDLIRAGANSAFKVLNNGDVLVRGEKIGAVGPVGPQGLQGVQGPKGEKGDRGPPGKSSAVCRESPGPGTPSCACMAFVAPSQGGPCTVNADNGSCSAAVNGCCAVCAVQ